VGGPAGATGISAPPRGAVADYRSRPREYGLTFQYNFASNYPGARQRVTLRALAAVTARAFSRRWACVTRSAQPGSGPRYL
jgi:hypothetical protein